MFFKFVVKSTPLFRYIRSDHYKCLLATAIAPGNKSKRFFSFPTRTKKSSGAGPTGQLVPVGGPGGTGGGIDPGDFEIYGMDGTGGSDDDERKR